MTTQITPPIYLTSGEEVEGRMFTNPGHVAADSATLGAIVRSMARLLDGRWDSEERLFHHVPDREHWHTRVVIPSARAIRAQSEIAVVGFFGLVRNEVDPDVKAQIDELGERLTDTVLTTPGLLAYCSHLLADERNYANLVLLDDPALIARWRDTAPHPRASSVSSDYYEYVRIYNGSMQMSAFDRDGAVDLHVVKYWDYRSIPIWHAVRTL